MSSFDPAEISGLIDGELAPGRAAELRAAIAADPALAAECKALREADAGWRAMGRAAAFTPAVALPAPRIRSVSPWMAVLTGLVPLAWIVGKLAGDGTLFLVLNGLSLSCLVAAVVAAQASAPGRTQRAP